MLANGCTRVPTIAQTPLKPKTAAELKEYLLSNKADVELFRLRGPFAVKMQKDHELRLSDTERVKGDLFLSSPAEKLPLVIFLHGYDSSKEAHEYQAVHVASWGMHALTLQLPNKGAWASNGRTAARIVNLIQRSPSLIDERVDVSKIILVGHSFGGTSVAHALAEGAPAAGGILLDPAAIGRDLPKVLQRVGRPVIVLGADEEIVPTRNRHYFYRFIRGSVAELSIRDAAHEDAQYPSEFALNNFGIDPDTTEELQITFVSALTSAAMSLAVTGSFDYAWTSYGAAFESGKFFNPRRK